MIIAEDNLDPQPSKGVNRDELNVASLSRTDHSSDATQSSASPVWEAPPPYSPASPDEPLLRRRSEGKWKKRAGKRFSRAFLIALFLFVTIGLAFDGALYLAQKVSRWRRRPPRFQPAKDGFECLNAMKWGAFDESMPTDRLNYAELTMRIPITNHLLRFESPDISVNGMVEVSSEPRFRGYQVLYQVRAGHPSRDFLGRLYLCRKNLTGHGSVTKLYVEPTENQDSAEAPLFLDVGISLPNNAHRNGTHHYPDFQMNMPSFKHDFTRLHHLASFGHFSVNTTDKDVKFESLHAEDVSISTTRGSISGKFNSSSLSLSTSSGSIITDATVVSLANQTSNVSFISQTGSINATVQLGSPRYDGGTFSINASTSTLPFALSIPYACPFSTLTLDVHTAGAPSFVHLPAAYEGPLSLRAQRGLVWLEVREPLEWPGDDRTEQRVRKQELVRRSDGSEDEISGRVFWVKERHQSIPDRKLLGMINVTAMDGPLYAVL